MRKKNDELLKLMDKIEKEKPVGWGFSKKKQETPSDEFSEEQMIALSKAIKKIEVEETVKSHGVKQNFDSQQILDETAALTNQTKEDREKKMQEYKDRLILERNEQRSEELMRTSFYKLANQQKENLD